MPQIFVFTAGNPEARQHLVDSIQNPVDDAVVCGNFGESHHEELRRIKKEGGGFYAWGAVWGVRNRPTWEQMERDDFVLCVYDGAYRYVARLLARYDNPECAEEIWGTNDEGRTWRYMYFLTEPIEVDQPLYEFEGHLHSRYQGFTRIADARLEEIEEDYGSVEEFIKEILQYEGEGLPGRLQPGPSRSEKIAEETLQVDDVTRGEINEKVVPDSDGDAAAEVAPVVQKGDLGPFLVGKVPGGLTAPVVEGERVPLVVPGAGGVPVWLRRLAIYLQSR